MSTKSQQQHSAASEMSHWERTMISQPWQRIPIDVKLMEPCQEKIIPPIDLSPYNPPPFPCIPSFDTFFKNMTTDKKPRQAGDLNHNVEKTQSKSKFDIDSRSHSLKRRSSVSVIWDSSSVKSNKLNEPQKESHRHEKNVVVDKYHEKRARSSASRIMDVSKTVKQFAKPLPPLKHRKHSHEGEISSKTKINGGLPDPASSELHNDQFLKQMQQQHPDFDFPQAIAQINWAVRQRNKGIALENVLRSMVGANVYSKVTSQAMSFLSKPNGMTDRVSTYPPPLTCPTSASKPAINSQPLTWKPISQNLLPPFSGILPVLPESTDSNQHVTSPTLPLLSPTNLHDIPGQPALTIPAYTLPNSITDINQKCDLLKLLIAMNSAAPTGIPINQDVGNGGTENILTSALYNRNGETQDMVKQKLSYMRSKSLQHITLPQSILAPDQIIKPLLVDMVPSFGISQPPINTSPAMTQLEMVLGAGYNTSKP